MKQNCTHYDCCRNPASECNESCERSRCEEREFGFYETTKGKTSSISEFTKYGWKTTWSKWYQNDSDFDYIGQKIDGEELRDEHERQEIEDKRSFMTPEYH